MRKGETPAAPNGAAKVKVRAGETGLTTLLDKTEVLILRVVRSLTFTKFSTGTAVHSACPVKVTQGHLERAPPPSNPNPSNATRESGDGSADDQKPKSPIFRPRAVLSSPDNDEMIGSINKKLSQRPYSKMPDPKKSNPSVLTHRNTMEETPKVKTGSVSKQGALHAISNITKRTHEHMTRRSSMENQRLPETRPATPTQRVHIMDPVTPAPRPVTPTEKGVHIMRPVTPPPPRSSPVSRPVTPTPSLTPPRSSPVSRPVTPTPSLTPPRSSPVSRPVTPTPSLTPPRSPRTRPGTPTPPSPITSSITSTPKSPVTRPVTPTPKSPLTVPRSPLTRTAVTRSPLTRPVTPIWK